MTNLINDSFTLPCGQVVKNRVCKAAMTERIAKGNNLAHQGHANLYDRWISQSKKIIACSGTTSITTLSRKQVNP